MSSSRIHGELRRKNSTLVRDPVDPLRLRLTCHYQPFSQSLVERWTYLIQCPRMYPHQAPLITRVTREIITNENMARVSNVSIGASAAIVANSVMQMQTEPPVPEQILVRSAPPPRNKFDMAGNREHEESKCLTIDAETAMFNFWTPISTLGDLVEFLITIPSKRREWWSVDNNRFRHQQQLRLIRAGHEMRQVSNNENNMESYFHQVSSSSRGGESDDDNVDHMMDDSSANNHVGTDKLRDFPSNRFDVGFPRESSIPHWDMMHR